MGILTSQAPKKCSLRYINLKPSPIACNVPDKSVNLFKSALVNGFGTQSYFIVPKRLNYDPGRQAFLRKIHVRLSTLFCRFMFRTVAP